MNKPAYIIIHTAAASSNGAVVHQSVDVIRNYHVNKLGWRDIGYHYYIESDGQVRKGRPEEQSGAHCKDMGMNSKSIGICCSGHGDIEDFTPAQYESLFNLCEDMMEKYGIGVASVLGHRETGAKKTCPGGKVDMDRIRYILGTTKRCRCPK